MQRPRRWWGCLLLTGVAAVGGATLLYLFAPGLALYAFMAHDYRELSEVAVRDLAEEAALDFPADARITHFEETPPPDPIWVARVVMSDATAAQLIRSVEAHRAEDVHVVGALWKSKVWWKPSNVVLSRIYTEPRSRAMVTVVVSREEGLTVAYVEHAF